MESDGLLTVHVRQLDSPVSWCDAPPFSPYQFKVLQHYFGKREYNHKP